MHEKHFSSFFLFFASYGLLVGRCVRLGWRTDWIDCESSSFTPCCWLRSRNVKKIIGSLCRTIGSVSWLTTEKQVIAGRGSNTEPGTGKPAALFHHLHRIVDSSWQSSPDISLKNYFKYSKFWGVDNFSYKLIIQCCVWAWSDMSMKTFDIRRVV